MLLIYSTLGHLPSKKFGKIEENYVADIIVVDDNPLKNLKTVFDPVLVFKDGIQINEQNGLASFEDIYLN